MADRLPAQKLRSVPSAEVWSAVDYLRRGGAVHSSYGPSTFYDLVTPDGVRLPPKQVYGVAASRAFGFEVISEHFSGGRGTPCFEVLEAAGFKVIEKSDPTPGFDPEVDAPLSWPEGERRLVLHQRRERRVDRWTVLNATKAKYGKVICARCGFDPVAVYGEAHGLAAIEIHHAHTAVADMEEGHQTSVEDLQCLCANCHRIEHAEMRSR